MIHTAAKAGMWGPYNDYYDINVRGTENIIKTCKAFGVHKLVYTSSPSVVFAGTDQEGIDENEPYPKTLPQPIQKLNPLQNLVLKSKAKDLSVVALRPHLIWGPGDNHLAPRLIKRQKQRRLRFVGKLSGKIDAVYVENAAHAHILALNKLSMIQRSMVRLTSSQIMSHGPRKN